MKLPSKIKDHVVGNIEDGANYDDIVQALLAKVGKSMVELENEFFPPRRRNSKDRVERVKELISWGKRVLMLCPKEQDILLFLVRGALFSELLSHDCGLLRGQSSGNVEELTEAVRVIRDNNITRGRDEARFPHGSSTSTAGGVLEGTALPVGGADAKCAPTMGGESSRVVPGAPTAGVGVCNNLKSKGKCKVRPKMLQLMRFPRPFVK